METNYISAAIQVEVILNPQQRRDSEIRKKLWEQAVQKGAKMHGDFDLLRERPDPNFFLLFYDLDNANKYQEEVFQSGISNAVYVNCIGITSEGKADRCDEGLVKSLISQGHLLHPLQISGNFNQGKIHIFRDTPEDISRN